MGASAQGQPPQRDGSQAAVGWRPPRQLQGWDCCALNLSDMDFVGLAISAPIKSRRRGSPSPFQPRLTHVWCWSVLGTESLSKKWDKWAPATLLVPSFLLRTTHVPEPVLSLFSCLATFFVYAHPSTHPSYFQSENSDQFCTVLEWGDHAQAVDLHPLGPTLSCHMCSPRYPSFTLGAVPPWECQAELIPSLSRLQGACQEPFPALPSPG